MAPKFAPAPWIVVPDGDQNWRIGAPKGDPSLDYSSWKGFASVYGSVDAPEDGAEVGEANARLIAAAPEMYHALKEIADRALIDDRSIGEEAYDMLRELRALLSRIDGEEGGHE